MIDSTYVVPMTAARPGIASERAARIARYFGLPARATSGPESPRDPTPLPWLGDLLPRAGRITLLTGPSGAGKSTLLKALARKLRGRSVRLDALPLPALPLVDCFPSLTLEETMRYLARFGLAEAWTCIRTARQLSAGQRWRLKLALALHNHPGKVLLADEFAAMLDRVTAHVVTLCLRKIVRQTGARAILATSHNDLIGTLDADIHADCDFVRLRIRARQTDAQ